MSNLMKVPHTVVFEAIIDLDKIPANLLPSLLSMSESDIQEMCKGATINALEIAKTLEIANANNSWAEVTIKEGN